jgi:hypothetical protein
LPCQFCKKAKQGGVKHYLPTCIFYIFVENNLIMAEITITNKDWERVKIKLQRKYNHLTDEQLQYTQGQEEGLVSKLMELVKRDRNYILFTLKKALVNIDNNRL